MAGEESPERVKSTSSSGSNPLQPLNVKDPITGEAPIDTDQKPADSTAENTGDSSQQLSISEITENITEKLNEVLVHLNKKDKEMTDIFDKIEAKLDILERKL